MLRETALRTGLRLAPVVLATLIGTVTLTRAAETPPPPDQAAVEADPLVAAIRQKLSEPARGQVDREDREALTTFYAGRTSAVWTVGGAFSPAAHAAMSEIAKADDWGLSAAAFELPQPTSAESSQSTVADAELKLWLAILKYARHARGGRIDPSQISAYLDQKPDLLDPKTVIQAILSTDAPDAYLRSLHPKHPQFERLRQALLKARAPLQSRAGGDDTAELKLPDGPNLKPGTRHADIALLHRRLGVTADQGEDEVYDQKLEMAVKAFQLDHGLPANGIVTARTRSALNGKPRPTSSADIQRLIVNMERWRWMPADLGEFYVWDNVPEYMTHVVRDGQVIHSAKIVVGKVSTQTPIFSADMKYIVFHPEWGVPESIKTKEILPYLRATSSGFFGFFGGSDTRILDRHRLRVSYNGRLVDASQINWSNVDIRQYQFIQSAGSWNVLGVVKFRFPNKHDVYMHDTPERNLFGGSTRAFSHGCMRVQDPGRLAEILLAEDKGWSSAHVQQLLAEGYNNEVELTRPIPVHVTYFTTLVAEDGSLKRFEDPYSYDSRISLALTGKPLTASSEVRSAEPPARDRRRSSKARDQEPMTSSSLF